MSAGQGIGAGAGAILGALVLAPLTAGASIGALATLTSGQIIGGVALGASLGSSLGGLIDPPRPRSARSQHEILQVGYNTFAHDVPVPICFNLGRINGNVMFQGNTSGRVEVVGQDTYGSGKQEQTVDVQQVVYYADFVIGLCAGPIRRARRVWRDQEDISDQEGSLFEIRLGTDDEEVPSLVRDAANAPADPVPWRKTAKLLWSGKLGEVNQLPQVEVEVEGPDPKRTGSGSCVAGLPANAGAISYDELTDQVVVVDDDRRIVGMARDGSAVQECLVPLGRGAPLDRAFYDGRIDRVVGIYRTTGGVRTWVLGRWGYLADSDWVTFDSTHPALTGEIRAAAPDPEQEAMWLVVRAQDGDVWLVQLSLETGSFDALRLATSDGDQWDVRGMVFEIDTRTFHVLYLQGADLRIRRFRLKGATAQTTQTEEMKVYFAWRDPIGLALHGELYTVFDASSETPLHQFDWGATADRFVRGVRSDLSQFNVLGVEGIALWLEAEQLRATYSADQAVAAWQDRGPLALTTAQFESSRRPILKNGARNGYAALRFDGQNDRLDVQGPVIDHQAVTMFIVAQPSAISGSQLRALLCTDDEQAGDETHWLAFGGGPGLVAWTGEVSASLVAADQAVNEWAVWTIVGRPQGLTRWKNGRLDGTAAHAAGGGLHYVTRIGGQFSGTGGAAFQGDLAELLIFDRALGDSEREQIAFYLRRKYAIAFGGSAEYQYLLEGAKLNYRHPAAFWYAAPLHQMLVLERYDGSWQLLMCQWDGSNWASLTQTNYAWTRYDEDSSAAGVLGMVLSSEQPEEWSMNLPARCVPLAMLDRLSGYCNRPVDQRFYDVDQIAFGPALRIDYQLQTVRSSEEILREMLTAINAFMFEYAGELHILCEGMGSPIEARFDIENIVPETLSRQEIAAENRHNDIRVRFLDLGNDWKSAIAPFVADWEIQEGLQRRPRQFDAIACIRPRQAAYLAQAAVLSSVLRRHVAKFETGIAGIALMPLSKVTLTWEEHGWFDKKFLIAGVTITPRGNVQVSLIEALANVPSWPAYPLQKPDASVLAQLGAVLRGAARVDVIEDNLSPQLWLFASAPDDAGAWSYLRWMIRWVQSATPGAVAYPGPFAFSATVPFLFASSTHFSPSGILVDSITSATALAIRIGAISGQIPEGSMPLILVDREMPAAQFVNTHGDGKYERMGYVSQQSQYAIERVSYGSDALVTVTRGGVGAGTHTIVDVAIMGIYVRQVDVAGATTAPVLYFGDPGGYQSVGEPWDDPAGEMYLLLRPASFNAGLKPGANALFVRVYGDPTDLAQDGANLGIELSYSAGGGEWKKFDRVIDDTNGFSRHGYISWDQPTDWTPSGQWGPGTDYAGLGSLNGGVPFGIRIRITAPLGTAVARTVRMGCSPNPPSGAAGVTPSPLNNFPPAVPVCRRCPIVYWVVPNATTVYPFLAAENGFTLDVTPQPVGPRGQSLPIDQLPHDQHQIKHLVTG